MKIAAAVCTLSVALLACAGPSKEDVVQDRATAISLAVKACPYLKTARENWRAEYSDGDWYVWDGIPECHFSNAHVRARDGEVSRCQVLVCSG